MSEPVAKTYADLVLPLSMVTKADVSRLVNEAELIDNQLTQNTARARVGGSGAVHVAFSVQLADFLDQNNLAFDETQTRIWLIKQLRTLKDNLPVVHMTFATVADGESLQQLVQWLRSSVHQHTVISVGIQPALIAGVYMRTPSHVYDLSLRTKLKDQRSVLVKELEQLRAGK